MDAYFKYVKDLKAGGYTSDQIKALLNKQGLAQTTINSLMSSIMPTPEVKTEIGDQALPEEDRQARTFKDYVEYVKSLIRRGDSWTSVDRDLIKRGVKVKERSKIIGVASKTLSLVKKYSIPTSKPKPEPATEVLATNKLADKELNHAEVSTNNEKVTELTTVSDQHLEAEKELTEAAQHLEMVAEHLSEVVDKLDNRAEQQPAVPIQNNFAETQASNDAYARQLINVSSNLTQVAAKLEEVENRQNFNQQPVTAAQLSPSIIAQPLEPAPLIGMPREPSISLPQNLEVIQQDKLSSDEKRGMLVLLFSIVVLISLVVVAHSKTVTWLSLLGLNVVGTVGFNLLLRKLSWTHKDDWFTAAVLQTGLMIPFLAKEIVAPIHFPAYKPFDYFLLATAVTGLISLQYCNVSALKNIEASVYSVVFNTRILFATIFATVFLGEVNHIYNLIGGLLIFLAIFVIKQKGVKAITTKGVLFAIGAALSMSIMNTCEKELIQQVGYEQYIFPMFTIAAIIMWSIVLMRKRSEQIPFKLLIQPQSMLLMVLRACAGIGFSYSLVFGPVAVSSYISSLSVVLLVVFGMLFLGEKDYVRSKIIATLTAIAGLTFILLDSIK